MPEDRIETPPVLLAFFVVDWALQSGASAILIPAAAGATGALIKNSFP